MNFSTPSKIVDTIRASDETEQIRQENRIKINNSMNGAPSLTPEQAKRMGIKVNVNWGEMSVIAAHARRQYDTAFLGTQNFFKVSMPMAPEEKKGAWAMFVTNFINRKLKRSEKYACMKEYQNAALVAHGIGPTIWENPDSWQRRFVALEDFRVATDTQTSLENLGWLAVRVLYTEGELAKKVFGRNSDPGWKKPVVQKILKEYHNTNYETTNYDWINSPEKMAELVKQNGGFYSSDAVPTIPLWHFYFMDDSDILNPQIRLRVVPDLGVKGMYEQSQEFIYTSKRSFGTKWEQLVSIQYGDLNNKAPFLHQSVRSLGFLLMEPCFWTNVFRCRMIQHGMEAFNIWLRITDPDGKAKAQKVDLFDKGIIPDGVSVVGDKERHQVNGELVNNILAQLKQLQSEASQTYTQSTDTGTQREQTAFETRVKVASVNAMMSGLLTRAFRKETYAYYEICRRFCLRKSMDADVQEFQEAAQREGIPKMWLNAELWEIEPEQPIGSGNPTMAHAEIQSLLENIAMFDPTAQQEIKHEFVEVVTQDPRKAERWVPINGKRGVTDAQRDSEFAFGTLMQGVPVRMKEGLSAMEQVETLLGLMAGVVTQIEKNGNMADAREIMGLQAVGAYINQLIQQLAQDEKQKAKVKQYSDMLGKLMNAVKAFAQRLQQQRQQEQANGENGQAQQVQQKLMDGHVTLQLKGAQAKQDMALKEKAFEMDQRRKDAETAADIGREDTKRRFAAFNGGDE